MGIYEIIKGELRAEVSGAYPESVINAAAKYGGTATITTREGWFELRVLIPLGQPQQK